MSRWSGNILRMRTRNANWGWFGPFRQARCYRRREWSVVRRAGGVKRDDAWKLLCEYTQSESLRKHGLAVEAAMPFYARKLGENEEAWGVAGLIHDFDYERWPNPPEHTREGAKILNQ